MNVALIGSVSSSWYALDALIRNGVEITAVMGVHASQRDRISDYRSLHQLAGDAGIFFQSFVRVSEPAVEDTLRMHRPDMLWVIGLSQLVPDRLISLAPQGGVGFHPTMLPEGRGRAPVAWTILRRARAAATLFYLTDEPDAGDIISQCEVPVGDDDYSEDLIQRTNLVLADMITELAPKIVAGRIPRRPQDHTRATSYPKRTPADGRIDWTATTDDIYRLIRAAGRPYPGAFTHSGADRITVWRGRPACADELEEGVRPGCVIRQDNDATLVATADGGMWLTEVSVERDEVLNGLAPGRHLGQEGRLAT